jgi:cyclophilin family peptidyl-prolyl cis-trans isomerase
MKFSTLFTAAFAVLLSGTVLAQALPATTPVPQAAVDPAAAFGPVAPAVPATPPPLPTVTITLNGRATELEVESTANPLVLIQTTRGDLVVELFPAEAPRTVENFLALAEGTKPFLDPATGTQVQHPFYDGLAFHRIVAGFVIQGGSPTGGGDGGPGFTVPDEINAVSLGLDQMPMIDAEGYPHPLLGIADQAAFQQTILKPLYENMGIRSEADIAARSSEIETRLRGMSLKTFYELLGYRYNENGLSRAPLRGMLAMAGSGPGTAGSQFFITLADAPWLVGRHTVFGKLRAGQTVLDTIGRVPVDAQQRPLEPVTILLVRRIQQ